MPCTHPITHGGRTSPGESVIELGGHMNGEHAMSGCCSVEHITMSLQLLLILCPQTALQHWNLWMSMVWAK